MKVELFSVSSAGNEAPVRLNQPLVAGGDVNHFEFASERVVYVADQEVNDVRHLYSMPIAGGTSVRLDGAAGSVIDFRLTKDGSSIVFRKDEDGDHFQELSVVPVDGSSPPLLLTVSGSSEYPLLEISPTSDRLVFVGDPERDGREDLFSVCLAGGSPVRISDPGPSGRIFLGSPITSDGQRVLHLQRLPTSYANLLFSVPITGGSSPILLTASLSPDASVRNLALTPDGSRVVFAADGLVEGLYELFSMPPDGSTGPVRLHSASAGLTKVTPDGTRAVYLVPTVPGGYELHVVPLDASSPPIVLSPARVYDLFRKPFLITPDSRHVVFRAGLTMWTQGIHAVPLDGSRPPVELSHTLAPLDYVRDDFELTPDGRTAVYRIGRLGGIVGELFQVPLGGLRPPVRVSGSSAYGFEISPDGHRVLHRTTQDTPGVVELYATKLLDPDRRIAPR